MAIEKVTIEKGTDGVAVITIDHPPVNSLSTAGSNGELLLVPGFTLMNDVIEGGSKPVVAAIEGFALGGGLELAMGCHARITVPKVQLGLVELQLGIIPGLGGTQRLPRLVGLQKAIDMLLASKTLNAEEAHKFGLVDDVVAYGDLLLAARKRALDIYEHR